MLQSPYTPGAGHSPEVLAGRDPLLNTWRTMLVQLMEGGRKRAEDTLLTGPRGVGKTALLSAFHDLAAERGYEVIMLQAVAGRGSLIDGLMARADKQIRANSSTWKKAQSMFERIGGVQLGAASFTVGLNVAPGPQRVLPDAGLFADGLAALADAVHEEKDLGGLLFTIDEIQVTDPADLALLAATLQRLNIEHPSSPVAFAATGLPNTLEALKEARVTHPERLFRERKIALSLDSDDARYAVIQPALNHGVSWDAAAVDRVVREANCYPAHLQSIAHTCWTSAAGPNRIELEDMNIAVPLALKEIEERTFEPRWDTITDRQAELLAAMAVNGGSLTSKQLVATLGRPQSEWSMTRAELIAAGDVFPPAHGRLALAVPTFTDYVLRNYPERAEIASVDVLSLDQLFAAAQKS